MITSMPKPVLQIEDLTKRYGALTAVDQLSLEVVEGEVFGFLGPNGAGKTTTINMICGLLKPDAGRIFIHGQPVSLDNPNVRSLIGVCPQNVVLWERLTCLEQLQFMGVLYGLESRQARRRADQMLEELDLRDKRDQQARTLSGGMQRRLNLALALVHDPQLIVLDEPEAGLDPQSRVRLREYICSLARQAANGKTRTIILTTHNMDEADRVCDRIAIIDFGKLLELDTPTALKQRLGPGDLIEIHLAGEKIDLELARAALTNLSEPLTITVDATGQTLQIRHLHAVGQVPNLLRALAEAGFQASEVNIRSNTLEDVFIQLTGRRLRE